MTTVYKYVVYCVEEAIDVSIWSESVPTLCPHSHADRTIDPDRTRIVDSRGKDTVTITDPTGEAHYIMEPKTINVPSGQVGDVTTFDFTWPIDIRIWRAEFFPQDSMIGDSLTVVNSPNTVVGVITEAAAASDTVLTVSSTVTDNVSEGYFVKISNGVTTNDLGRITQVNKVAGTITVETAVTDSFTELVTSVIINPIMIKDLPIDHNKVPYTFNDKGLRAALLPKNTVMRLIYTNNSTAAKTWYWKLEYWYGPVVSIPV